MKRTLLFVFFFIIFCFIFRNWFSLQPLAGGDWGFFYPKMLSSLGIVPSSWNSLGNNGMGENSLYILGLLWYFSVTGFLFSKLFFLSWNSIEKLIWFWPYIIMGIFSSYQFAKKIIGKSDFWPLTAIIFVCNTYALMLTGGGQMGVALAYALTPFVLACFITLFEYTSAQNKSIRQELFTGLVFALQVLFDIRIAYITFLIIGLFVLWQIYTTGLKTWKYVLPKIVIPIIITVILHLFWLVPLLVYRVNPLEQLGLAYSSTEILRFFSFAKFENSLSLLHPNWPENIFGKVYFMRPEFIILPLFAYASLLFINKEEKKIKITVLFFIFLGLLGAFLAKGTNDPFGGIYIWLFEYIPGFVMFRDPTKFYLLIALSYSVLIPFTCYQLSRKWKYGGSLLFIFVFFFVFFLILPVFLGQIGGTFKRREIPKDYIKLATFLQSQKEFSRTLWVPVYQRYGFNSYTTPAISAEGFLKTTSYKNALQLLEQPKLQTLLERSSIGYIIVPSDSEKEIFIKNRKYDAEQYNQIVGALQQSKWLKEINGFGKIKVFAVPSHKGHFWTTSAEMSVKIQQSNVTSYNLDIKNAVMGNSIIFSENFDNHWEMNIADRKVKSTPYENLNSFILPVKGNYLAHVEFVPQKLVFILSIISALSFTLILCLLIYVK